MTVRELEEIPRNFKGGRPAWRRSGRTLKVGLIGR